MTNSRRIITFVRFIFFFICIGYLDNEVKLCFAFVESVPAQSARCFKNAKQINSASICHSGEVSMKLLSMKESTYSNSFMRRNDFFSYKVPTFLLMQPKNDDQNVESVFSISNSDMEVVQEVPLTRIKDIPLRIKAKTLSLYSGVSKRIVFTKKILLNIAPSFLFLSRMRRKSSTTIRATEMKLDPSLKESKNIKVANITPMNTASITCTERIPIPKSQTILSNPPTTVTRKSSFETSPEKEKRRIVRLNKNRLETCNPNINLCGKWCVVVTPELKKEYDLYLQAFRQPALFRAVALNVLSMTKDILEQNENGTELTIRGTNPRGVWARTLISSGYKADWDVQDESETCFLDKMDIFEPKFTMIQNAGGADVQAECWWEENGSVHASWVRNAKEGDFFSRRYIDDEGFYVCESSFYHNELSKTFYGIQDTKNDENSNGDKRVAFMTWKFQREE